MIPNPRVSVIIVSWNNGKYLISCLDHLLLQSFRNFETILIDNGSTHSVFELIGEKYPSLQIHIRKLDSNFGYAAANNIGARLAKGQWLVLLNADAFPEPEWLEKLVAKAEVHPEITSFSSCQIQADHPEFLDGAGDAYHVSGMAWRRYIGYPSSTYGKETTNLFSPCAAAAMYLREAFLEVGGFDEDLFSYFEDVDLGFRLQLRGYSSMYVPDAVVHHVGSASFGARSDFALYHTHRNLIWTFFENMPTLLLLFYLPQHIALNLIYLLYYTLQGRGKTLWKAKWDAIKGLPRALKKRSDIQCTRQVSNRHLLATMQRGWLEPYLLGYHLRRALKNTKMDQ